MATCTSCGSDVTGKKFCPNCGKAVNPGYSGASANVCPRCHGDINPGAAFCMHCGSSLSAQPAASGPIRCAQCGRQNDPGTKFCNGCGKSLTATQPAQTYYPTQAPAPYGHAQAPQVQQQAHQAPAPYGHAQAPQPHQQAHQAPAPYGHAQAPQVQVHVHQQPGQQYPAPYGQQPYTPPAGYHPQPVLGHNAVVITCPNCGTVNSPGTMACYRCHTGLAGIHSRHMPVHHGYHGYHHGYGYHRRRDSGWLGGGGSGDLLLAGGAGLVGGLVLGEVLEDFFD